MSLCVSNLHLHLECWAFCLAAAQKSFHNLAKRATWRQWTHCWWLLMSQCVFDLLLGSHHFSAAGFQDSTGHCNNSERGLATHTAWGAPALAQPNGKHLLYKYTWHNRKYLALRFVTHVLWKQTQPGAFSKHPGTALKHGSASHKWASWLPACKRSTRNLPQGYQHDHSAFPTWLRVSYGRTRSIVLLRPFSPDQRCPCSWKASAALPNAGLLNPSQSARARTPLAKRNSPTERWGRSVFETCYKTLGKTWYKKDEPPWVQPVAHAFPPARPARKSSLTTCFLGLNRIDRLAPTSLVLAHHELWAQDLLQAQPAAAKL